MKKITILCCLVFIFGLTALAGATPITFDLAGQGGSFVNVTENVRGATLTASLDNNLDSQIFTLGVGQTQIVDFFTLTTGTGYGNYSITAQLGFDLPNIGPAGGSGNVMFLSLFGLVSGGTLNWADTLPDYFTLADGNRVRVDFEEGFAVGCGNSTMVHAYITNLGGSSAPVPESGTLLLLGSGLVGIFSYGRSRMKA